MKLSPMFVASVLMLTSCGTPGIVHMDGDTYFIQKRSAQVGFGPPEAAKAEVYEIANKFCAERGMALETVNFSMVNSSFGRPGSVALQFRCVAKKKQPTEVVATAGDQNADIQKRLRAVKDLRERGLIDDEEYQKKRSEILNAL